MGIAPLVSRNLVSDFEGISEKEVPARTTANTALQPDERRATTTDGRQVTLAPLAAERQSRYTSEEST